MCQLNDGIIGLRHAQIIKGAGVLAVQAHRFVQFFNGIVRVAFFAESSAKIPVSLSLGRVQTGCFAILANGLARLSLEF